MALNMTNDDLIDIVKENIARHGTRVESHSILMNEVTQHMKQSSYPPELLTVMQHLYSMPFEYVRGHVEAMQMVGVRIGIETSVWASEDEKNSEIKLSWDNNISFRIFNKRNNHRAATALEELSKIREVQGSSSESPSTSTDGT